jgi:uncharacterized integral membrane protein
VSDAPTTPPEEGAETQVESHPAQAPPQTQPVEPRRARLRRHGHQTGLYTLAFSLVALLVVLIALVIANTRQVKISWVVGSGHASLVWIMVATTVLGWLLGIVTSVVFRIRTRPRRIPPTELTRPVGDRRTAPIQVGEVKRAARVPRSSGQRDPSHQEPSRRQK